MADSVMTVPLELRTGYDPDWLDEARELYERAGMTRARARLDRALAASYRVATAWDGDTLVGIGRAISDGEMYAGIFDVAVLPASQGSGVGRAVMRHLEAELGSLVIHLTSTFGNEPFYERLGYGRHRTAFAKYPGPSPYLRAPGEV